MKVNYEILKEKLISLKTQYGYTKDYIEIVKKCLRKDELQRLSSSQLVEILQKKGYRDQRDSIGTLRLNSPIPKRGSQAEMSTFDYDTRTKLGLQEYVNNSGQASRYGFSNKILDSMDTSGQRFNQTNPLGAQSPIHPPGRMAGQTYPNQRSFDSNHRNLGNSPLKRTIGGTGGAGVPAVGRRFNSPLNKLPAYGNPNASAGDIRGSGYYRQQPGSQIRIGSPNASFQPSQDQSRDVGRARRLPPRMPQPQGNQRPMSPTVGLRGSGLRRSGHQVINQGGNGRPDLVQAVQQRRQTMASPRVSN